MSAIEHLERPDPQPLLEAAELESVEDLAMAAQDVQDGEYVAYEPPRLTLTDAVRALRRIAHHQRAAAEIERQADELIAPLQAEIDRINAWAQAQLEDRRRRIGFWESQLILFYRDNPPAKGKTLQLPGGRISSRDQQPEWAWQDVGALADALWRADPDHPALEIRVRAELALDKSKLKQAVDVLSDGTVATRDGQRLPGVVVRPQPPQV